MYIYITYLTCNINLTGTLLRKAQVKYQGRIQVTTKFEVGVGTFVICFTGN